MRDSGLGLSYWLTISRADLPLIVERRDASKGPPSEEPTTAVGTQTVLVINFIFFPKKKSQHLVLKVGWHKGSSRAGSPFIAQHS